MQSILDAINAVINFIGSIPAWLLSLAKNFLLALGDMLLDLTAKILDVSLSALVALVNSIPVDANLFNANNYMSGATAEFLGMLVAIRVPEALAIIIVALGIRFLLGLIPFIRVGG